MFLRIKGNWFFSNPTWLKEADRNRTDQFFIVPVDEIKENDFDLSINKYKEIEYEKVDYESTEVILKKINDLEKEIQAGLAELED